MNDAVLLPLVLVGMTFLAQGHSPTATDWGRLGMNILILSPTAGTIVGLAAVGMLELVRKRIGVRRDYESIYSLGVAFAAAEAVHGSGFLAAFAAGLTISVLNVELCDCFLEYGETTAEMALMFTFVLLGTSVIWKGLGIIGTGTLLFVAVVGLEFPSARVTSRVRGLAAKRALAHDLLPGLLFSVLLHGLSPSLLIKPPRNVETGAPSPVPALKPAQPESISVGVADAPQCSLTLGERTDIPAPEPRDAEYISLDEVKQLQAHPGQVVIIDARSERTYNESDQAIPGAIRLPPDQAARTAAQFSIPKTAVLVVLCA